MAVLERLFETGATLLATTHYSEIKTFAAKRPGFTLGCMEFDIETLQPLYRLHIGQAGESNALLIALRLGMDKGVIERAHEVTYHERREYVAFQPPLPARAEPGEERPEQCHQPELGKKIEKARRQKNQQSQCPFKLGDSVFISSLGRTGIVYEEVNSRGE